MSRLMQFGQNNSIAVAAAGSASGIAAWLITHADVFILVFQLIGGFFGSLLAVVSFVLVLPKLTRFCVRAWRFGFTRADKE